jgi:hypothetical protein
MDYLKFTALFVLMHVIAYTAAGAIALRFSKDIYESKKRHCTFLRDMSDKEESQYVSKFFLPAQLVRGLLMAVVLFPFLQTFADMSFGARLAFFSSLMFVYTHFAAVSPFMDNIEGFVYFKKEYLVRKFFLKFQYEMVIYSLLFGVLLSTGIAWTM